MCQIRGRLINFLQGYVSNYLYIYIFLFVCSFSYFFLFGLSPSQYTNKNVCSTENSHILLIEKE